MIIKKPIILISLDYSEEKTYSTFPWYAIRKHYSDAIEQVGGIPLYVPYHSAIIEDYLNIADGIIVPGGDVDIPPEYYNESNTHNSAIINHVRTKFDFQLIQKTLEKKIPLLAICAGQQVLNVVLGGSMIQHIPDEIENPLEHYSLPELRNEPTHLVNIKPNSILHNIVQKDQIMVNSHHHQSVKKLGNNIIASGVAPDGVIEAIELEQNLHPFCLGLQWHPEYLETKENQDIYKYFLSKCTQ